MNRSRVFLIIGALYGLMSVALGAFAAHGLRPMVSADMLAAFETAARYQMYHSIALLITGLAMERSPLESIRILNAAGWCFALGTLLFSGSLYLFVLLQERWLAVITPLGGAGFLAGWLLLVFSFVKRT